MFTFLKGLFSVNLHDWPHYDIHGHCRCECASCVRVRRRPILSKDNEIVRIMTLKRVCQGRHVNIHSTRPVTVKPMTRILVALTIVVIGFIISVFMPLEYVTTVPDVQPVLITGTTDVP